MRKDRKIIIFTIFLLLFFTSYVYALTKVKVGEQYVGNSCNNNDNCFCNYTNSYKKVYVGRECVNYEQYKCNCHTESYPVRQCERVNKQCYECTNYGFIPKETCHYERKYVCDFWFIICWYGHYENVRICNTHYEYGCTSFGLYDCSYNHCYNVYKEREICSTCTRCTKYKNLYETKYVQEKKCYVNVYSYLDDDNNDVIYNNTYPIYPTNGSFKLPTYDNVKSVIEKYVDNPIIVSILTPMLLPLIINMLSMYFLYKYLKAREAKDIVTNFLMGILYGEGDGIEGFAGDVIISSIPFGDLRDIVFGIMQRLGYDIGNDIDNIALGFSIFGLVLDAGLFTGIGEVGNSVVGVIKSVWKKVPRSIRRILERHIDDVGKFAIKMGEVFSNLWGEGKIVLDNAYDAIMIYFNKLGKYLKKGKNIEKFNEIFMLSFGEKYFDDVLEFVSKYGDDIEEIGVKEIIDISKNKKLRKIFSELIKEGVDAKVLSEAMERMSLDDLYKLFTKNKKGIKKVVKKLSNLDIKIKIKTNNLDEITAKKIQDMIIKSKSEKELLNDISNVIGREHNDVKEIIFVDKKTYNGAYGFYSPTNKNIVINVEDMIGDNLSPDYLLRHEMLHSFTAYNNEDIIDILIKKGVIKDTNDISKYSIIINQAHDLLTLKYAEKLKLIDEKEYLDYLNLYKKVVEERGIIDILSKISDGSLKIDKNGMYFLNNEEYLEFLNKLRKGEVSMIGLDDIKNLLLNKNNHPFIAEWMVVDENADKIIDKINKLLDNIVLKSNNVNSVIDAKNINKVLNTDVKNLKEVFKNILEEIKI